MSRIETAATQEPHAMTPLTDERRAFQVELCRTLLGDRTPGGALSVADKDSRASVDLAEGMASRMATPLCPDPPSAQATGAGFARLVGEFLQRSFLALTHVRPGDWIFDSGKSIHEFDQYEHLAQIQALVSRDRALATSLGGDYLIVPDVIVARRPLTDGDLNAAGPFVDDLSARFTPLREGNIPEGRLLLHASVSCKWSIRSDRAQNTRAEALNLIRNRKGASPHIAFVTMEPLPSRIASIALGTGDIDCCYHGALHELIAAADDGDWDDAREMLQVLVDGRRLRDISDLPLDLAR